ncbi:hypothetical protein H0H87_002917 [Tephrocybe sp. NHM501043]|nr:hypothetical protein H0H87_002917 [Tephrocybe sp. NHM501043]
MAAAAPPISIISPTPPRPTDSLPNSYRLLYRGALSLPDSDLLLDGLTFAARLDSPSKNNHLLQNPLALALESMRGRPSLRFMGVVKLHDDHLWLDESGGIEMDVHPRATLTRIYFENVFCLNPFASTSTSAPPDTSDVGIKVALGDSDGPETTQVVIFARSNHNDNTLNLIVARLSNRPPPTHVSLRLPRPDDPTPRKPPVLYASNAGGTNVTRPELKRGPSLVPGRELKRVASVSNVMGTKSKKVAGVDDVVVADLGSGVRLGDGKGTGKGNGLFKVPEVPLHSGNSNAKGKGKQVEGDKDVFGSTGIEPPSKPVSKGKRKRGVEQDVTQESHEAMGMERTNKDTIKLSTRNYLYNTKDPTSALKIDKSHPEFKGLFNCIYRGVEFALRSHFKVRPVDIAVVDHLVRSHADMYIGGHGDGSVDPVASDGEA